MFVSNTAQELSHQMRHKITLS